ncbi:MAG: transglutaminaseTgpA domain-containing protein [Chloroflexi bacterium]|nr:transglutaminaseTgpA domain-containing protein [Chloroflexota bacterium]
MLRLILGPREGWLALLLLMVVVLGPAVSLADAAWVDGLWIAPWLAFFAILLGFVLAKLPVRGPVAHLFAAEVGLVGIGFYFAAMGPRGDWEERFGWLFGRISAWLQLVFGGGMGNDNMLFALLMSLVAWLLGYLCAWLAFRRHNVLLPIVACASALLLDLSYGAPNPETNLLVVLMASLLLLIRITLFQKERDWAQAEAEYHRSLTWNSLWGSALLSAGLLVVAWALPIGNVNAAVAENWYRATGPWQGLQVEFDRLFASIGSAGGKVEGNRFAKTMALKGAIELGTDPVMVVSSPLPEYWAAQAYDQYNGHGWISTADRSSRLEANDQQLASTSVYRGRVDVEQRVKLVAGRTSNVFAATSPVKLSLPVYADHFDSLEQLAALRSTIPMRPGQQYAVISSVSVATADQLRQAGKDYPDWTSRYLELPRSSARRATALARRLAGDAGSPYGAALAIQEYLRGLRYEVKVETPPPDRDAVDWFLFTSKEGYCDYFASAMAVMARAIGIPSRVVSGYNTGILNERAGLYEVRQENAHSWPELFFPGYGWVRFEPTPSQPVPERPQVVLEESSSTDPTAEDPGMTISDPDLGNRDKPLYGDDFDLGADASTVGAGQTETGANWKLWLAVPLSLGIVLLALWLARKLMLSRLSLSGRAYLQMYWIAGLLGWRLRPSYTPDEYAQTLSAASPGLEPEVRAVAGSYAEETYGGRIPAAEERAVQSWQRMRWRLPLRLLRLAVSRQLSAFSFFRRSAADD